MKYACSRRILAAGAWALSACGSAEETVSSGPLGPADATVPIAVVDAGGPPSTPVVTPPISGGDAGGGGNCLVQPIDTRGQAPDMLIVLDRSFSMQIQGRWQPSVQAVSNLATQYQSTIQLGLSIFPAGGAGADLFAGCEAGKLDVPFALGNGPAISQAVSGTSPGGATPTMEALQKALEYVGPRTAAGPDTAASRPGYVLLVTDGEPTCGDQSGQGTIAAAKALSDAGVKVFVVGYQVQNTALMNQIAAAGGSTQYYPVESQADLQAAFQNITKDVVRCDFDLATTDAQPNPDYIYVSIDNVQRKLNELDGWVIDGKHITLQGQACTLLKDGGLHTVQAEQRCELVN